MARSYRPLRAPSKLTKSVLRRLDLYALAASAAGIGMAAQPVEAKIVYTAAHVPIVDIVNVDLNHDGIVDLKLNLFQYGAEAFLDATSLGQNRIWGSGRFASHLLAGVRIKPNQEKFAKGAYCGSSNTVRTCKGLASFFDFSGFFSSGGPWAKHRNGYLGAQFYIQGKVHFGWARLQRTNRSDQWVLTGYAYETVAGKPIVTGQKKGPGEISVSQTNPAERRAPASQPATLGMLALGAPGGLAIWRRKESVATQ
jgi:hypothetical protein